MLALRPGSVRLMGAPLDGVVSVSVDRTAERLVVERGEAGPHATFVDAPEVRVRITVRRELGADAPEPCRPGDEGSLRFRFGGNGSDARESEASALVVAASVSYGAPSAGRGVEQRIELIGVSPDGAADPLTIVEVGS